MTGTSGGKLCNSFDYIAAASTGAIIAAGLARGMTTAQLIDFYRSAGKEMFEPAWLIESIKYFYTADPLKAQLQSVFGPETNLEPNNLQCLLWVVTKNVTTDSPWPISSNPEAKYNALERPDCNLKIPLWQLVRASTAAPVYFLQRFCSGTQRTLPRRLYSWTEALHRTTIQPFCRIEWQPSRPIG